MNDEHNILNELSVVRRRIRLAVGLRGALLGLGLLGVVTLFSFGVDRVFRLGVPARSILLTVYLIAVAYFVWKFLLRPLRQRLKDAQIADILEREQPQFEDLLRSAVHFLDASPARSEFENFLRRSVIAQAGTRARQLGSVRVLDRRVLGRSVVTGVGAFVLVLGLLCMAPVGTAAIWFQRTVLLSAEVDWPYRTRLLVEGFENGVRSVPRGDPMEISVRVEGELPERAWIHLRYASDERRHALSYSASDRLRYSYAEVREEFQFHVRGGDFRSREYTVRILERPILERIKITRHFPAYIGVAAETTEEIEGDVAIPVGASLEIEARCSKPVARAQLLTAAGPVEFRIGGQDGRILSGEVQPAETETVVFDYTDVEGVRPERPAQIHLRLVPDRKPEVKLRISGIGTMVSPQARIPFRIEAGDDYRVDAMRLHHRHVPILASTSNGDDANAENGASKTPEGTLDLTITVDSEVVASGVFDVALLKIEPEASLTLQAGADDSDTLNGPKTGLSTPLDFIVVSARRLMEDFLRRQEEQRRAFERLIKIERDIRDDLYGAMDGGLKAPGELGPELKNALRSHARRERSMTTQVVGIRQALANILEEMKNNGVGEADDLERIADRVVSPLRALAEQVLPELAQHFNELTGEEAGVQRMEAALALSEQIETTLDLMQEILANMIKLEGFTEIVNRLRSIIKLTGESSAVARDAYEKMLDSLFEDG